MWFFSLVARSVTYWKQFEIIFMTHFEDDKTFGVLFLELSRIKINKREKIKDFNQRFITLLNWIPNKPIEVFQIEFYIVVLPPLVAMFIKSKEKQTLIENFQEAIKVEKYLVVISSHSNNQESKSSTS